MMADNKTLARFILDGIPPAPRGVPQVEVTFDIDANGILTVKAVDKSTNKEQSVKIEASTSLNKDEIERLKKEAAEHAAEDERKKELAELRNQAEMTVYQAEKALKDAEGKVSDDVKNAINEKVSAVKAVKDGTDAEAIKKALSELSSELQKIGEAMYNKKEEPKEGEQNPNGTEPTSGQ
jgi:molecular chaperone DnaK